MAYFTVSLLCTAAVLQLVSSHPTFRDNIPNGLNVKSPCNPDTPWLGVGHRAVGGGGPRNQFGKDFEENGNTWTEALCRADSDNDSRTNGEELGDPNCIWTKGAGPEKSDGLSHPGICEPHDSDFCRETNSFLDCETTKFKCDDVINDQDVKAFDLRLDMTAVPAKETTYMCQVLDVPSDQDYHLVAYKPYIDNINVMHHALVRGCSDAAAIEEKHLSPVECFTNRIEGCEELLAIWAKGNPGICYHEDAGFRMGKSGYSRVVIEIHWNNPSSVSGYTDSSGLTLYLNRNLRANDAGMFMIGQVAFAIPPGLEHYTANSTCSSECTEKSMEGNINIVGASNHMHSLGASAVSQMVSGDGKVHYLSYEENFSYDSPKFVVFDEPVVMEPGYKLQMYCHFDSTDISEITYYGDGANQEMCYGFIMYYPKSNWQAIDCVSNGNYDPCGVATGLSPDDCDYAALGDPSHPATAARNQRLYTHCEAGYCKDGCLDVVRDIFQGPCFKGYDLKIIKEGLRNEDYDVQTSITIYDYFYRLDSCNAELAWEQRWRGPVDGAVSSNMASFFTFATVAIFVANL